MNDSKIWMDGQLVDFKDAKVHVLTHCLHYGSGVFEGIRIYDTKKGRAIFRLEDHMVRFMNSAKAISMPMPYELDELCEACREVVRAAPPEGDYLRPLAFFGMNPTGNIGVNPLKSPVNVVIACTHMGAYVGKEQLEKGAKIITSSWEKPSNRAAMLNAKVCGNYINSVVARVEAIKRGADEALMLNANGTVAEGTGENIFMVKKGLIITPDLSSGVLEGITRDSVMTIAKDLGYNVIEKQITRSELYLADEVLMTGTAAEVTPIGSIDDVLIGEGKAGPITKAIQKKFAAAVVGKEPKYKAWLDLV
ncbi:MAG: branched-chain amino acid aminotransferase [Methanomassiliicoccales archaeon PtaU1.Bin124]|nr:MAG: branched-chain amino acid aminotransferase [Methanomassiliicoccales archaeon PtaU1.Bin124]